MTALERLLELRKKATQATGDEQFYADRAYRAALVNWFDLPSTQAMLEKGERKLDRLPEVFQVLVDWENKNGTLAAIMEDEYAGLCKRLADATINESPRQAADRILTAPSNQRDANIKICELIASTGGSAVHCVEALRALKDQDHE